MPAPRSSPIDTACAVDDSALAGAARRAVFPSVPWQHCQFHLQQNAQSYVPQQALKTQVASEIRSIFQSSDQAEANLLLKQFVTRYQDNAPELSRWTDTNLLEGLSVMALPLSHWHLLRTTNMLERQNKDIKRCTRVASLYPNTESCLRLVSAVLMEVSEGWETSRIYLTMKYKSTDKKNRIYRIIVALSATGAQYLRAS